MSKDGRNAWRVEGTAQPTLVAARTSAWLGDLDSVACRCAGCTASIGRVVGRLGWWLRRWMDL